MALDVAAELAAIGELDVDLSKLPADAEASEKRPAVLRCRDDPEWIRILARKSRAQGCPGIAEAVTIRDVDLGQEAPDATRELEASGEEGPGRAAGAELQLGSRVAGFRVAV
jgi:hypothetical protein